MTELTEIFSDFYHLEYKEDILPFYCTGYF